MWQLAFITCLAASAVQLTSAKVGYIFTAPNTLSAGTVETCSITFTELDAAGYITVSLLDQNGNKTLLSFNKTFPKPPPENVKSISHPIALIVPKEYNDGSAKIKVEGHFQLPDKNYNFEGTTTVGIHKFNDYVFIQTDKPIYQAGQTVLFRVLMTNYLFQQQTNKTCNIWIDNPSSVRLAQWPDTTFENVFAQLNFALSDQPNLGAYTISCNCSNKVFQTQSFQVAEYVLPKFEVVITPPPYALVSDEKITWKICGKYTYGKLVNGNLTLKASFESYSWDQSVPSWPNVTHVGPIEGCYNLTVQQKQLPWYKSTFRYRYLRVFAKITEDGTGIERNATSSISLTTNPLQLSFKFDGNYGNQFFKPGLPFHGRLFVSNPDNTPRADELCQLCSVITTEKGPNKDTYSLEKKLSCKNFTSDSKGIINFTIPPGPSSTTQFKIQADAVNFPSFNSPEDPQVTIYKRPTTSISLYQWVSPSNHFIQIEKIIQEVPCGDTQNLKVMMTGKNDDVEKLYIQMIARGNTVMQTSRDVVFADIKANLVYDDTYIISENQTKENRQTLLSGSISIPITFTSEMTPQAHLLLYYIRQDGEIIADSLDIKIAKCLNNNVTMKYTNEKQYPGTDVGVTIKASPNSICSLGVVDRSVYLLGTGGQLTLDYIFGLIQQYDVNSYYWYDSGRCNNERPQPGPYYSPIIVQRRKRATRGIIWKPNSDYSVKADSATAFQNSRTVVLTDLTLQTKRCDRYNRPYVTSLDFNVASFGGSALARPQAANAEEMEISKVGAQDAFLAPMPNRAPVSVIKPVKEVRDNFIETWLWELFTTDDNGEAIFKRSLPDTITEWTGNAVCVNSKDGLGVSPPATVVGFQPFFVSMSLPYSIVRGETSPVTITVFSYLEEPLVIKMELDKSPDFELLGAENKSGENAKVFCVEGGKSVTHTFLIKPLKLGKLNVTARAYTFDEKACGEMEVSKTTARDAAVNSLLVVPEGFKRSKVINKFFCPENGADLAQEFVLALEEPIVQDSVYALLTISGDLMGPTLKNIEKLVQMPTGCGEQNMLNFVPNIVVYDYLENTKQMTPELKSKLLRYMEQGYKRELSYRHVDGSYSAFGETDPSGSLWLTSFVIRSFYNAKKFIFVDPSDIKSSALWVTSRQDKKGCFPQIGEVHHSAMQGGVDQAKGSSATLTAYTMISLIESKSIGMNNLNNSLSCLALEQNPATYTLALMTYATCLAKSPVATGHLETLMAKSVEKDGLLFWNDDISNSKSIQIEIAAYTVLSLLQPCGGVNVSRAQPIIRWIANQRNSNGGFISTQDTVVAIQALASYASLVNQDPVNIQLSVESNDLDKDFVVDQTNKLLAQSIQIKDINEPLFVKGKGIGCALIQASINYNIPKPANNKDFSLTVTTVRGTNETCKKATMTSCFSYNSNGKSSNMAIMQIRPVSGYVVDPDTLKQLFFGNSLNFKRYDIQDDQIVLYFSKVEATSTCFTIGLNLAFEVKDALNGTAVLMDYYEPEQQVSVPVSIDAQCP